MKNPNCDNEHCKKPNSEIRILPTGGDSNALLCYSCYLHEIAFRKERNKDLADDCKFKLTPWEDLRIYLNAR